MTKSILIDQLRKPFTMITNPRILIVEDNESDADLLCRALKKSGMNFTAKVVQTRMDFERELVDFSPDIVLSDYSLPSFDAVTAFRITHDQFPHIPFIIVSAVIGEENAVELIKDGVTDYASKNKLFTLAPKINRALEDVRIREEKFAADNKLQKQQEELLEAHSLLIKEEEKVKIINRQLLQLNQYLEQRVVSRTKDLAESESRFRNMMETLPQIAWTNTTRGKVAFYNQRWYDYTGLSHEQTEAKGLSLVIHPDDVQNSRQRFHFICKMMNGGEFQTRGKRADGSYRWHLIRLMPIKNAIGQMQLWVGTATDIEELKVLQQQKDDFISIASHELKTPITSLKASLQLLDRIKDNPSSPMFQSLIAQANKSLNKVNALVEDLLNASKANDGQVHISKKLFTLSAMINDCCQYVRAEGVYNITTEGDMGLTVVADAERIEQVVINFINNAIKYAPASKQIKICIEKTDGWAKISVKDEGAGIPPEKLDFLFDRYYRVDNRGAQYTGLGLGLYICAEIIKKHDGEIGVNSELNKGSSFWFKLPL